MIEHQTFTFLKKLEKSNNREWFQANKKSFDTAQDNLTAFTGYLIGEIGKFDDAVADIDPKSCVFRIYRDVRFSKDKSPYKTNLGAYISPGGRKSMQPGYYFHIQPGRSFIAGGKHMPDGQELLKTRTAVADRTTEFLKIVESKKFRETFGDLYGDKLKTTPKGFDAEHRAIEYLKLKEFMAFVEFPDDKLVTSSEFPRELVRTIKQMYPLVAFLREALT